jgi:predicted enzyme related to lactoylglutathione lyase
MPVRNDFKPGQFCWIDFSAHDLEAAAAWYGELFGWAAAPQDTHGGPPYMFFLKGEAAAAAGGQLTDEMKAAGVPPMWNSYVNVDDCAAMEKKAAALGANITVPTMDVPGHGKLCFMLDPAGASIAMWETTENDGVGVFVGEHGGLSWNELMCRDAAASREFYGQLFGWEYEDMPMDGVDYTLVKAHGEQAGGMMPMTGEMWEGVPEHWMVYFAVDDCDAFAAKASETGGTVCVPPTEIPVGKFAVLNDPQGGTFSVIQMAEAPCE